MRARNGRGQGMDNECKERTKRARNGQRGQGMDNEGVCGVTNRPLRLTLATMYSASSGLSSESLCAMSLSEILEYDRLIMRTPVLMTLWRRRMISLYVSSAWNLAPNLASTSLKRSRLPIRTAVGRKQFIEQHSQV